MSDVDQNTETVPGNDPCVGTGAHLGAETPPGNDSRLGTGARMGAESTTGKRPGRPATLDQHVLAVVKAQHPHVQSRRGIENLYYAAIGRRRLLALIPFHERGAFDWLLAHKDRMEGVLSQLGRVKDDGMLLRLAKEICRRKLWRNASVRLMREFREAVDAEADVAALADELVKVVERYRASHNQLTLADVRQALEHAKGVTAAWTFLEAEPDQDGRARLKATKSKAVSRGRGVAPRKTKEKKPKARRGDRAPRKARATKSKAGRRGTKPRTAKAKATKRRKAGR